MKIVRGIEIGKSCSSIASQVPRSRCGLAEGPRWGERAGSVRLVIVLAVASFALQPLHPATIDTSKIPPAAKRNIDFAKDIEPIFSSHCYNCHGPKKQEASLRLDQKAAAL